VFLKERQKDLAVADNAPSTARARETIQLLQRARPPTSSLPICGRQTAPTWTPVDYQIWDVIQHRVYKTRVN